MGFREARAEAIRALEAGRVQHVARDEIDEKNLLVIGEVTPADVVTLLKKCRGDHRHYECKAHHQDASVDVHIFRPEVSKVRWYIKLYFLEPDVWFISVHK